MRILLTNDDGIDALGIRALAEALSPEHEVVIVAPDSQRSGASHSFTLYSPLRCRRTTLPGLSEIEAYAVNGTPVDCVKLAFGNLPFEPNLLIAGINCGENRGTDVFYSGTVAAAMEAALLGIPAIAASCISFEMANVRDIARVFAGIVRSLAARGVPKDLFINVNVPDLPYAELKGVAVTALSNQTYENVYDERIDTRGQKYFWIPSGKTTCCSPDDDNDERWGNDGYVVVTPLKADITDFALFAQCRDMFGDVLQ
ncbi:MAG: 5'/3'-nucleotidase SurE [Clostridia bacterium]|nr:5'/3'-nucleotidase SurE [Clostridia bacterium]